MIIPKYLAYIVAKAEKSYKEHCNFEIEVECNSIDDGIRWMKIVCLPEVMPNGDTYWFGIQTAGFSFIPRQFGFWMLSEILTRKS